MKSSTGKKHQSNQIHISNSTTANKSNLTGSAQFKNVRIHQLKNCTLILLNIYLLAHKATCNYEDFVNSLSHYDCLQNNFSVRSNCNYCKVCMNCKILFLIVYILI